ncbi:MAG: molybdopterin-synthase adenylyltransferase MoeB [Crocinitomicaceae bacterium]
MSNTTFSKNEYERYSRHLILPEFNLEGQKRLKRAKVLVVGAGGLGTPVLQYLVAAGVGTIGIVDDDVVSISNLQRQVLFGEKDLGRKKTEVIAEKLSDLNPHVKLKLFSERITSKNARSMAEGFDLIVDGSDNFPTRYLLNDLAVILRIPYVYGAIYRFEGQVSVFNYLNRHGELGPNYRDLFPDPPPTDQVPSCAEGGVIGVLPGMIGTIQANEVIKIITGIGEVLSGRLFLLDALTFENRTVAISKNVNQSEVKELIDYENFCGWEDVKLIKNVKHLSVQELKKMMDEKEDYQLIDVREPYEADIADLPSIKIPQKQILDHINDIPKNKKVVFFCRSGKRSAEVVELLTEVKGMENIYNLNGGILEWADKIDTSLARY